MLDDIRAQPYQISHITQDRRVMVERSDRMWSTGEGNGKPLQYFCLGGTWRPIVHKISKSPI